MLRTDKVEFVSTFAEKLKSAQSVVLADFKGISVAEMTDLRAQLRSQSIEMKVVKNRLLKRALNEAGCDALDEMLVGNTSVTFGMADAAAPAKILVKYAKDNEKLVIKGGLLEGKRLEASGIEGLSRLPGRPELLTRMAYDLKQPATKMATVMQAGLLKVAHAMNAYARKLEESGQSV